MGKLHLGFRGVVGYALIILLSLLVALAALYTMVFATSIDGPADPTPLVLGSGALLVVACGGLLLAVHHLWRRKRLTRVVVGLAVMLALSAVWLAVWF